MRAHAASELLERDGERAAIAELLDGVADGVAGVLVLEGEAGIGKTSVLGEAVVGARERGFDVLQARGAVLEREFPFGVARQLFEASVAGAAAGERRSLLHGAAALSAPIVAAGAPAGPPSEDPSAPLHGLYWLTANLAERAPLGLIIDDAQWADASSLRFLAYLARRLEGLRVALFVAARVGEAGEPGRLLAALRAEPVAVEVRLGPLSQSASAEIVRRELGGQSGDDLSRACYAATRGNPFLLVELLRSLRAEGIVLSSEGTDRIAALAPPAITRSVLLRLAAVGGHAPALAAAVAVLGDRCELRLAAGLAELEPSVAAGAADALCDAVIFARGAELGFVHPVVRGAVYDDLGQAARRAQHARAARLLASEDAPPERIAAQIVLAERTGDPWAVERLRDAARLALGRAAPAAATALLSRAVEEPPLPELRPDVLRELGLAELLAADPDATVHLREALELTADPFERAGVAAVLATAHSLAGDVRGVADALEPVLDDLPADSGDLRHMLEAAVIAPMFTDVELATRAWMRLARLPSATDLGESLGDRALLAIHASRAMLTGTPDAGAAALLVRRALSGDPSLTDHPAFLQHATNAMSSLALLGLPDEGHAGFKGMLERAAERGSATGFAVASCFLSWIALETGRLQEAEADARAALRLASDVPLLAEMAVIASSMLCDALLEQGQLAAADEAVAVVAGNEPSTIGSARLLFARGRLASARRDFGAALADQLRAGRSLDAAECTNPAIVAWRSEAALAHLALGEREPARALAADELERARRFGAPRPIAIALRAMGLVEGGPTGVARLAEAASILEDSPARLERARVLIDHGAALRRAARRVDARDPLRQGLDLALRCSAKPLVHRAREELAACGARPRRLLLSGVESLTATERRIALLAADGMTNKEIAQAQFVTRKTVEAHLSSIYRKLSIRSRRELPTALAGEHAPDDKTEPTNSGPQRLG